MKSLRCLPFTYFIKIHKIPLINRTKFNLEVGQFTHWLCSRPAPENRSHNACPWRGVTTSMGRHRPLSVETVSCQGSILNTSLCTSPRYPFTERHSHDWPFTAPSPRSAWDSLHTDFLSFLKDPLVVLGDKFPDVSNPNTTFYKFRTSHMNFNEN